MLLTWRATVFSLRKRSAAIVRLVLPVATSRSTSSSRAVNPCAGSAAALRVRFLRTGEVGRGAELPERPLGRVELHRRGLLVPELAAGEADQHPGPRGFVRSLEFLPGRPGLAQRSERAGRVALAQQDGSSRMAGQRPHHRRPELVGQLRELIGGGARRANVTARAHHLDERGQES